MIILRLSSQIVACDRQQSISNEATKLAATVKKVRGVVGDQLQSDINQINKRHIDLCVERDTLQTAVNARTLTDEDIAAALQFREDTIAGLQNPTFDDKRRMLEILQVRSTVKDGVVTLQCRFPTFSPSFEYQTAFDWAR